LASVLAARGAIGMAKSDDNTPSPEEMRRRLAEWRAKALAGFPYERIQVPGAEAYVNWRRLKAEKRAAPVVLGDDDAVSQTMENLAYQVSRSNEFPDRQQILRHVQVTLAAAQKLRHPQDLRAMRADAESAAQASWDQMMKDDPDAPLPTMTVMNPDGTSRNLTRDEFIATVEQSRNRPEPVGTWPTEELRPTPDDQGVTVAFQNLERKPLDTVNIAIIPTEDWTEIPAYLGWGGWNECPAPEYHVAALRGWRDRYGAELIGLGSDVVNLRTTRFAATREEALDLAREQYLYCADIVDQGTGSLSLLAANLMVDPWWFFWWD
jgi:hypothetical protein